MLLLQYHSRLNTWFDLDDYIVNGDVILTSAVIEKNCENYSIYILLAYFCVGFLHHRLTYFIS